MVAAIHLEIVSAPDPGPIVVEVPHAGLVIDDAAARFTRLPAEAIAAGALLADSDVGAGVIWRGSEALGVTRVVARASRYVIDLNTEPRLPTPYEEKLPAPLRAILHRSHSGARWRQDALPREEIERRIREVFEPYHAQVDVELERALADHGAALLLCSHTFPDSSRKASDVVLGTRHGTTASVALRDEIARAIEAHGFSVALEEPFPGGWSVTRHARPSQGVHVVQVEIARRLLCSPEPRALTLDDEGVQRIARMLIEVTRTARETLGRISAETAPG